MVWFCPHDRSPACTVEGAPAFLGTGSSAIGLEDTKRVLVLELTARARRGTLLRARRALPAAKTQTPEASRHD